MTETGTPDRRGRLGLADLLMGSVLVSAWVAFFAATGTIGSGYHLSDDHEILRIISDLRHASYLDVLGRWAVNDLAIRFRPLYFVHRIAEAAILGDDLRSWGVYTAALGVATSLLLYLALRWLRFPPLASLAFVFFSLAGRQGCIWWWLGPNETIGMVFLAVGLLGLARWSLTGSWAWRVLFWAGTLLASLSKESFVAILPALAFATVWSVVWQRGQTWRRAAATCAPELAGLAAVLLAEALVITLFVGVDSIGYAGVSGVTPQRIWKAMEKLLPRRETRTLLLLGVLLWLVGSLARSKSSHRLVAAAPPVFLGILVLGSQAFLYAKPGVLERYLVPGAMGGAFLVACILSSLSGYSACSPAGDPESRRSTHVRLAARGALVLSVLIVLPLADGRVKAMVRDARSFAAAGRETQWFLDELTRAPADRTLLIAGGLDGIYEHFYSIGSYLRIRAKRDRVSFLFVAPEAPLSPFQRERLEAFRTDPFYPKFDPSRGARELGTIGVLPGDEPRFLQQSAPWFDPAAYVRHASPGGFSVFASP